MLWALRNYHIDRNTFVVVDGVLFHHHHYPMDLLNFAIPSAGWLYNFVVVDEIFELVAVVVHNFVIDNLWYCDDYWFLMIVVVVDWLAP